eukprot:TRINITY_DN13440_c4_g1_i1.p1 TRINITY_DN13440_c4_g1~~TRINITY_DN13440_c4_g1_i1.p1  ORF type:complete len:258 (+),score=24.30 TRINITY_DN13440_c4_g1_i1:154-927(+)
MHISRAIELQLQRRRDAVSSGQSRTARRDYCIFSLCFDYPGHKLHVWIFLAAIVIMAVVCIGMFEAARLSTHVLRSPCTIVGQEVVDIGTCTLCDGDSPANCEVHPVSTARLMVNFRHHHSNQNTTGYVWYCKNRISEDPCVAQLGFLDQLSLDVKAYSTSLPVNGPIPCTTAEVLAYMQLHTRSDPQDHQCFYSSRDLKGEDVWLSMPSPGLVDHAWFQKHLEYPVLLALGGLVLLTVLLGCLAVEGAELWFSGIL